MGAHLVNRDPWPHLPESLCSPRTGVRPLPAGSHALCPEEISRASLTLPPAPGHCHKATEPSRASVRGGGPPLSFQVVSFLATRQHSPSLVTVPWEFTLGCAPSSVSQSTLSTLKSDGQTPGLHTAPGLQPASMEGERSRATRAAREYWESPTWGWRVQALVLPHLATERRLWPESLCCTGHSECGWAAVRPASSSRGLEWTARSQWQPRQDGRRW